MRLLTLVSGAALALAIGGAALAQPPAGGGGGPRDPAAAFKAMDKNGDGAISKDEWTAAGRPAERFDMVDTNKDGKITAEEMAAAPRPPRPPQ